MIRCMKALHRVMLGILMLLIGLMGAEMSCVPASAERLRTDDFSSDPGWDGLNNRVPVNFPVRMGQGFGYRADTNLAGSQRGEIGGYIQSAVRPAWYAKVLERSLDIEQPLAFSGSFFARSRAGRGRIDRRRTIARS